MSNQEKDRYDAADAAYLAWKREHPGQNLWESEEGTRLANERDAADRAWAAKGYRADGDPEA